MYLPATPRLLLLLAAVLLMLHCYTIPSHGYHPEIQLKYTHVRQAVQAINELFRLSGDLQQRFANSIILIPHRVATEGVYIYYIDVSGGKIKELCKVSIASRPGPAGEPAVKIIEPTQCYQQKEQSGRRRRDTGRTRRSDIGFDKVFIFLNGEFSVISGSSKVVRIKDFSHYKGLSGGRYRIFNVQFAATPCDVEMLYDNTADSDECYRGIFKAKTVATCSFVLLSYDYISDEIALLDKNCTFNEDFPFKDD